jgi:hypothetical protein
VRRRLVRIDFVPEVPLIQLRLAPSYQHLMDRPRLIRGLRIAWSVAWGILCVLLILLWVRSYKIRDSVWLPGSSYGLQINSLTGHFATFIVSRASPTSQFVPAKVAHDRIAGRWADLFDKNVLGFYFGRAGRELRVDMPHWFCVLALAIIGIAPWKFEGGRFSLRTLLIATTLIAVVLGLTVAYLR